MAWTDKNGNRWMFGGFGFEVTHPSTDGIPGYLNDMWVWPTTLPITSLDDDGWWLPGGWIPSDLPTTCGTAGCFADTTGLQFKNRGANYGTQGSGTACALNFAACTTPGGRWGGITWTDATGNLWMFGGQGFDANGHFELLNDIWEFDITSGPCGWDQSHGTETFTNCKWIWQGGSKTGDQATTGSFPGGRWGASTYTDGSGNMWMFGGQGYDSSGQRRPAERPVEVQHRRQDVDRGFGRQRCSPTRTACTARKEQPLPATYLAAARPAVLWADSSGAIWLFGGFGLDSKGTSGGTGQIGSVLNDLWKYRPEHRLLGMGFGKQCCQPKRHLRIAGNFECDAK